MPEDEEYLNQIVTSLDEDFYRLNDRIIDEDPEQDAQIDKELITELDPENWNELYTDEKLGIKYCCSLPFCTQYEKHAIAPRCCMLIRCEYLKFLDGKTAPEPKAEPTVLRVGESDFLELV